MTIYSSDFSQEVIENLTSCENSLIILSAFVKIDALKELAKYIDCNNVTVIVRWQKCDILFGASDLEVYELCKANSWRFGICNRLHAKVFLFDNKEILLGSANLTSKGLGLIGNSNIEFGTRLNASEADILKINEVVHNEVVWVSDELYQTLKLEIENSLADEVAVKASAKWSKEIISKFEAETDSLWVEELLFTAPQDILDNSEPEDKIIHDLSLLGLYSNKVSHQVLQEKFKYTKVYKWLVGLFKEQSNMSFGRLTHLLHSSLLNDPTPYRKSIKEFMSILFLWLDFSEEFTVTRPNYSQVVTYLK